MNSLFQVFYNIPLFRESILKCKCTTVEKNSLYELQKVFFNLKYLRSGYYTPDSFANNYDNEKLNPHQQMYVDEFFNDIDFKAIEGHNPPYPSKPSPYGVERIMDQLEVTKDETIYIGDSITDIRTSQNAEIDCILVSWGYGRKEAFESDYPIGTVDDVCDLLKII
jgi:ribonucleotide monophosphatase NagD (HAD superfamily)